MKVFSMRHKPIGMKYKKQIDILFEPSLDSDLSYALWLSTFY